MNLRAKGRRHVSRELEVLEARWYLTAVVGEHIFYNGSLYDGNNTVANSSDDNAIAPDKNAYHAPYQPEVPADGNVTYGVGSNPAAPVWSRERDADSPGVDQWTAAVRIPTPLIVAPNGTLLSFVELRNTLVNDATVYGFGLKLSHDNGSSWSDMIQLENKNPPSGSSNVRLALGASFVLPDGRIGLVYTYWTNWDANDNGGNTSVWEIYSNGTDYTSWSAPHEITSSVVKVNNSTPAGIPSSLDGTNSGWDYLLPTSAVTLANGNTVVGCVYRYDADPNSTSRFCTLQRDVNGNWKILGGLDDGATGTHAGEPGNNPGANESSLTVDANGNLRVMLRHKVFDEVQTSVSTDGGVTWSNLVGTGILASETQPAITSNPNNRNEMFLATINDASTRAQMTVFRSTDGGATWNGGSRVFYAGRASYPGIQYMNDGRLILLYENTKSYGTYPHEYQYISEVRFTAADLLAPDSALWYQFNERASGPMLSGPSVFSQGMDFRAFGQTAWNYNSKGVITDGVNGLTLAQGISGSLGNAWANRQDESFTAEIVANFSNIGSGGATQTILSNYNGSGKGWEIYTTSGGKTAAALITDNSGASITVTNPADLTAGSQPKAIALVYNKITNTYTLYVNGVAGPSVANTELGTLANGNNATLGARPTGSNPIAAGTVFQQVRLSRDLLAPAQLLTVNTPKTPFATYLGYTPPPLPSYAPTNNSHAKLWLAGLADSGVNVSGDIDSPLAPLILPVGPTTGTGAMADAISGTLFSRPAPAELVVDSDTTVGEFYYGNRTSDGGSSGLRAASISNNWDFIHENAVYTIILGAFRFNGNPGTDQILLSNSDKSISNDGFSLIRLNDGRLLFTMTNDNVTWRTNYLTTKSFSNNVWYTLAISSAGDNQPVSLYWAEWPGNMGVPTGFTMENAGLVAGDNVPAGSEPSDAKMTFGMRSDGGLPTDWSFKDIMIFDVAMQPSDILNAIKTTVWTPSTLANSSNVTNYSNGINGIMIDLADLPPGTVLSASDFQFRIGNNNAPDTWAVAPAPASISLRLGAGQGGSDRVTITWANGAIKNTWLQVTLKGNDAVGGFNTHTGLTRSDTFYFGNKVADSASTTGANTFDTTSTDAAQVFASIGGSKPITDLRDYNRDGQVSSTDAALVFANIGSIIRLNLGGAIAAPAAAPLIASATPTTEAPSASLPAATTQVVLVTRDETQTMPLPLQDPGDASIAAGLTISAEQSKRVAKQPVAAHPVARHVDAAIAPHSTVKQAHLEEGRRTRNHAVNQISQLADAALEATEDLLDSLLNR